MTGSIPVILGNGLHRGTEERLSKNVDSDWYSGRTNFGKLTRGECPETEVSVRRSPFCHKRVPVVTGPDQLFTDKNFSFLILHGSDETTRFL